MLTPKLSRLLTRTETQLVDRLLNNDLLWMPHPENTPQILAYVSEADILYYGGAAGGGKALSVDAKVITPWGFKPIGDIVVGDTICNPDGTHQKVIGVYPQGIQGLYKVTFQDGPSVLTTGDHLWLYSGTKSKADRKYLHEEDAYPHLAPGIDRGFRIATTQMLLDKFRTRQRFNPRVPLTEPVRFTVPYAFTYEDTSLESIDPYVLGLLLGDGGIAGPGVIFTSSDPELIQEVRTRTLGEWKQYDCSKYGWHARGVTRQRLNATLGHLGLKGTHSDTKFVPKPFLLASVEVRWELLQGLMDSDGTVSPGGKCSYCSTSPRLAQHVRWLVWSLGGRASLRVKTNHKYYNRDWDEWRDAKTAYIVHIQVPDKTELFKLPRKKERADVPFQGGRATLKRKIVSIEPEGQGDAVCLKVDHPNGLFLTDGFIVTHNTDMLLGLALTAHKRAIIFRREYAQLRELIDRSEEVLGGTGARYNQTSNLWRGIPGGRTLEFGAVQHEKFKEKFKGRPHDLKAFDEIPDFTESQFRFLCAWNRTTDPSQRCRVVCAGNPPTCVEGEWVIRYWAPWLDGDHKNPAKPGELRFFASLDGRDVELPNGKRFRHKGELITPRSRTFIPAFLKDNPYLSSTGYEAVLQGLPEPMRSQLLFGLFNISRKDKPQQVIPTEWIRAAQQRWKEREEPDEPFDALGVDPSRGGIDTTELAPRKGTYFLELLSYPGSGVPDGPACAGLVVDALKGEYDVLLNVDVIGVGSSVYDCLNAQGFEVAAVNFSRKSSATDKSGQLEFRNLRAEAYWKLREALDPEEGDDLALPPGLELLTDLAAPTWRMSVRGITVEPKKDIRKRLGRSPGKGDAVVLAHYESEIGVYFK